MNIYDDFPEDGTEDDKNRWAHDRIYEWEGGHLCPVCGEPEEQVHTGHWVCPRCDYDIYLYWGSGDDGEDEE